MKKILTGLLILGLGFGMSGCVNRGTPALSDKSKMKQIRTYKSTKKDVRRILGEPQSISTDSRGYESWMYSHSDAGLSKKGAAKMVLGFTPLAMVGTFVGATDTVVNGGDVVGKMKNVTFTFNKRGLLIRKRVNSSNISS